MQGHVPALHASFRYVRVKTGQFRMSVFVRNDPSMVCLVTSILSLASKRISFYFLMTLLFLLTFFIFINR
jgi:hypothetical protein